MSFSAAEGNERLSQQGEVRAGARQKQETGQVDSTAHLISTSRKTTSHSVLS